MISQCAQICAVLLFSFSLLVAQTPQSVPPLIHHPNAAAKQTAAPHRLAARAAYAQVETPIELPAVDPSVWEAAASQDPPTIGITRELPSAEGTWEALPDGRRIWRVAIHSPGAAAMRVHLERFAVGAGEVWIYALEQHGTDLDGPYSGYGVYGDGDFWSGIIRSDALVVEYYPSPERASETIVPFRLAGIAHLINDGMTPVSKDAGPMTHRAAVPCHLDFKCYPQYETHGRAVAKLLTEKSDGRWGWCSGTLLTTRNESLKPYLLTANHCVSSEAEARSTITIWADESSSCNIPPSDGLGMEQILGARLLTGRGIGDGDFGLLLLSNIPRTVSAVFAGWNPNEIPMGSQAIGIHHPDFSYKRISFGSRTQNKDTPVNVGSGVEIAPSDKYYRVLLTEGRVEGGSSGSPLFDPNDAIVLGLLSHAPSRPSPFSVCDILDFTAGYGRFSVMYPVLRPFLEDEPAPELAVSPTMLTFSGVVGGAATSSSSTVRVSTTSANAITATATASQPWIRLSRTSFSISANTPADLSISIDTSTLAVPRSYSGLVTFRSGTAVPKSVSVSLDLAPARSNVVLTADPNPVYQEPADEEGYTWRYTLRLRETSGAATRITSMSAGEQDHSATIADWFGTDQIPAYGSVSVSLRSKGYPVPSDLAWRFGGRDLVSGWAWNRDIVVRLRGPRSNPEIQLTSVPGTVVQNPSSEECPWNHRIVVTETGGMAVTLNRWVAGDHDLSADLTKWFGSTRLAARGTLSAGLCWKSLFVPRVLTFEVGGIDDLGRTVSATAQAEFVGPPVQTAAVTVSPSRLVLHADTGQNVSGRIDLQATSPFSWTGKVSYLTSKDRWLRVYPLSGAGAGQITVAASAQGLPAGSHTAVLQIEAPNATPNYLQVPIELIVSAAPGGGPYFTSESVVNAASFAGALAPGMLFSIFGERLADGLQIAQSIPLPVALGGTVVRANGIVCPLHFVSPSQINAQLPYQIVPGVAVITVEVDGNTESRAVGVAPVAPGLFTIDGSRPTPHFEGRRGQILICYITGAGPVSPEVPTGEGPSPVTPIGQLPRVVAPVKVEVDGVPALTLFAGIPPFVVGAAQINYTIPASVAPGRRSLIIRVGDSVTNTGWINVLE